MGNYISYEGDAPTQEQIEEFAGKYAKLEARLKVSRSEMEYHARKCRALRVEHRTQIDTLTSEHIQASARQEKKLYQLQHAKEILESQLKVKAEHCDLLKRQLA
jgi:hypothetical protein